MDGTNGQQAKRDAQRAAANRAELIARIAQAVPNDGAAAPLPGVELRRTSTPTALSPLQFQKQLRLQEARRLMLGDGLDAASAGAQVGYGNAAHFTREYKRLFGAPPMREVARLRDAAGVRAGL